MPRISRRTFVAAPADRVWDHVQDFAQWHPRLSQYAGGPDASAELVVTVTERDDSAQRLSYSMPEPPFPITDHRAVIEVTHDRDECCYVEWSASFESDPGIMQLLEDELGDDVFNLALDKLATHSQDDWAAEVAAQDTTAA